MGESGGVSGSVSGYGHGNEARDKGAAELFPLVYEQLRDLARHRMSDEKTGHTLQATALVNEAYLRLAADGERAWSNKAAFFFAAAEAMRRILIDHARARGNQKRGGGRRRLPLNVLDLACESDISQILDLDAAIVRLNEMSAVVGEVVKLRFYAGLSIEETA